MILCFYIAVRRSEIKVFQKRILYKEKKFAFFYLVPIIADIQRKRKRRDMERGKKVVGWEERKERRKKRREGGRVGGWTLGFTLRHTLVYTLEIKPTRHTDSLDVECEGKRGIKNSSLAGSWMEGVHLLRCRHFAGSMIGAEGQPHGTFKHLLEIQVGSE